MGSSFHRVALVFIALCLGGFVGFVTMGLNKALCSSSQQALPNSLQRVGKSATSTVGINGYEYNATSALFPDADEVGYNMYTRSGVESGYDITPLFKRDAATFYPACSGKTGLYATSDLCTQQDNLPSCPMGTLNDTTLSKAKLTLTNLKIGYAWDDLASGNYSNIIVSSQFL